MTKFVPVEKRSAKAKKEYYNKQRNGWNGVDPHRKVFSSAKDYSRSAQKAAARLALRSGGE